MSISLLEQLVQTYNFRRFTDLRFLETISYVRKNPPSLLTVEAMATYAHAIQIVTILAEIPPHEILKSFDPMFLLWLSLCGEETYKRKTHQAFCDATGRDQALLTQARKVLWTEDPTRADPHAVIDAYEFLQRCKTGKISIPIQELLEQSTKEGISLTKKRKEDYSSDFLFLSGEESLGSAMGWNRIRGKHPREAMTVSLESPVGFTLFYKGEPQAVCALLPVYGCLKVFQLQGMVWEQVDEQGQFATGNRERQYGRGARGLATVDWQKFLVLSAEHIGREEKIFRSCIRSGENNPFTRKRYKDTGRIHFPLERALKIYDATAERMQYKQDAETKDWYKSLE